MKKGDPFPAAIKKVFARGRLIQVKIEQDCEKLKHTPPEPPSPLSSALTLNPGPLYLLPLLCSALLPLLLPIPWCPSQGSPGTAGHLHWPGPGLGWTRVRPTGKCEKSVGLPPHFQQSHGGGFVCFLGFVGFLWVFMNSNNRSQ